MKIIASIIFSAFCIISFAMAQIPREINYQGVLTDQNGNYLNGSHTLYFSLFTASTGGTALWNETQSVNINAGVFDVILGSSTQLNLPFDTEYWLELTVDNNSPLPRVKLVSSPYSLNSKSVEDNAITSQKILDGTITGLDINDMGATAGQVLTWFSGQWMPHNVTVTESDPVYTSSPAATINNSNISNWNTAYGWGNHAAAGYLTSYTETDPVFASSIAATITGFDLANWYTAFFWGDHHAAGYLTSETDPIFAGSPAGTITYGDIAAWNNPPSGPWVVSGSDIYYASGNVGIGGYLPTHPLDVDGVINVSPNHGYSIGDEIVLQLKAGTSLALGHNSLYSNTSGSNNTGAGEYTLYFNTTGSWNTAAGSYSLFSNTTGLNNVATGAYSLYSNTEGNSNTANGWQALYYNVSGNNNVASGNQALYNNLTGSNNTATGSYSLYSNTSGNSNTAVGNSSLYSNTTGSGNTANGYYSMYSNTSGGYNTALGNQSLYFNTGGFRNTAIGYQALYSNTTGTDNTAHGALALYSNTTGTDNTAIGSAALYYNSTGYYNTALGSGALASNTSGSGNTAIGFYTLLNGTTGISNTAIGSLALTANTSGSTNTAAGYWSLSNNSTGGSNSAFGSSALYANTTGYYNDAFGELALYFNSTGSFNTALGNYSLFNNVSGNYNSALGHNAGPNSDAYNNTTAVGYNAVTTASDQIRIGNATILSIGGYQDWTNLSDGRFKKNVNENVKGLQFIMNLRPVTYNLDAFGLADFLKEDWRRDKDGNLIKIEPDAVTLSAREKKSTIRQSGFIAQEVEAAAHSSGYDFSGIDTPKNENDLYGLRYAEFVVPIIKAVQEQQKQIEEQKRLIDNLIQQAKQSQDETLKAVTELIRENKNLKDKINELQSQMNQVEQVSRNSDNIRSEVNIIK